MSLYSEEVVKELVNSFMKDQDEKRDLERILLEFTSECYITDTRRYVQFQRIIHDVARIHLLYGQTLGLFNQIPMFPSASTVQSIHEACRVVSNKRRKLILNNCLKIVSDNPAFLRSPLFCQQSLVKLGACRSLQDDLSFLKWTHLHIHIKSIVLRLEILIITLTTMRDLLNDETKPKSDCDILFVLDKQNKKTSEIIKNVSTSIKF